MQNVRIDLFTNPHKDLRKHMFELSSLCAELTNDDKKSLAPVEESLRAMLYTMRKHARSEDTYALPVIAYKLPEQREEFKHDHVEHERELHDLELRMKAIKQEKSTSLIRPKLILEFYRSVNRFIAHDLLHLDKEEYLMQNLWELLSNAELFSIMIAYKSNEEPENFLPIMNMALRSLSADEICEMFSIIHDRLGKKIHDVSQNAWSNHQSV